MRNILKRIECIIMILEMAVCKGTRHELEMVLLALQG